MPSTFTHYLLANRVYDQLLNNEYKYKKLILQFNDSITSDKIFNKLNQSLFWWGAQGPDYLFMISFMPWSKQKKLRGYGSRLHSIPPSITLENIRCIVKRLDVKALFYAMGFICHYALDSITHPFIKYRSVIYKDKIKYSNNSTTHAFIETNIDNIVLLKEKNILPTELSIDDILPINEEVENTISNIYMLLIKKLFGKSNIKDDEIESILKQIVLRYKNALLISKDETSIKKHIVKFFENKLRLPPYFSSYIRGFTEDKGFDFANLNHDDWSWPVNSKKIYNESFLDLFYKSYDKSLEIIDGFLLDESMKKLTKDKPFV